MQVHPNDDYAREHEAAAGGIGKTEMWYAVAARQAPKFAWVWSRESRGKLSAGHRRGHGGAIA